MGLWVGVGPGEGWPPIRGLRRLLEGGVYRQVDRKGSGEGQARGRSWIPRGGGEVGGGVRPLKRDQSPGEGLGLETEIRASEEGVVPGECLGGGPRIEPA